MLEQSLQSLGFAEKEAKTYLAALRSGPATALELSRDTAIPRATVYLHADALVRRGVLTEREESGKTVYCAAPPERLLELLQSELDDIKRRESAAREIITELKSLTPSARLPKVRLFEGLDGLEAMRAELLKYQNIEWYVAAGAESYRRAVPEELRKLQIERLWKNSNRCKAIVSASEDPPLADPIKYLYERYRVPTSEYPMPGEVAIFENTIALISYHDEPMGLLVENAEIAAVMRSLFRLAFEHSKMFTRLDRPS